MKLRSRVLGELAGSRRQRDPAISVGDAIEALRLSLAMEHSAEMSAVVDLNAYGLS